jgi:BirA family biotin operon repressor/biotin-[acetyl-CoA-carboxylase] ligase
VAFLTLDGVSAAHLAKRWIAPRVSYSRRLPSTLDKLHDLAAKGAPAGTVVVCDEQTAGRGRQGRPWHSPEGGAWLAVLFRPPVAPPGPLAIRVGLVLADVVDDLLGAPDTSIKWPNDVYLDDRKLAGILCEGRWQGDTLLWLAVGIGINVQNEIPPDVAREATALRERLPDVRRLDVLDPFLRALWPLAAQTGPLTETECAAFARRDWLAGRQLRAPLFGRARGIRPDGALLIETAAGTTGVREGSVELA